MVISPLFYPPWVYPVNKIDLGYLATYFILPDFYPDPCLEQRLEDEGDGWPGEDENHSDRVPGLSHGAVGERDQEQGDTTVDWDMYISLVEWNNFNK